MRNEKQTCKELIEPALLAAGWDWEAQVVIGAGRVNLSGESMYDETQKIIADYILRHGNIPLAVFEAKAEGIDPIDGIQQAQRYARRLGLRFSISGSGKDCVLVDRETQEMENFSVIPSPQELLHRLQGDIDWKNWKGAFDAQYYIDQVSRKEVRPFQDMAIFETLRRFSTGQKRVLLLMATGTGKTFTVFQLAWKMFEGKVLKQNRILFLTDRNNLKDQAYRAFAAFPANERVIIDKETVDNGYHEVGKIYFANYQNMDSESSYDGKKVYEHFAPDFFDLVVIDECHRSGFGDWFGVLEHFSPAFQLGLTATPRELDQDTRELTEEEKRRDTYEYFGKPAFVYSLRQAIDDGYLVPYLLEERVTNIDEEGYTGPDGKRYLTEHFEREIRLPDRTRLIAEDLWHIMGKYDLREEKAIVFCVDDTHAACMAQEIRRLAGDEEYAARITRSERNSHQLEKDFALAETRKPRIAVTVDLLSTGYDAPSVKNIVFVRPIKSSILYKQMKGRGTRLCEDIDKRYFSIFDYAGASVLEDAEFDGHPSNIQKSRKKGVSKRKTTQIVSKEKPVAEGVTVFISDSERYICLADGRKIPLDEYREQSKEIILDTGTDELDELLKIWIDKSSRKDFREELRERDIYVSAFRYYYQMEETDDVDILSKVAFDLIRVPTRRNRVGRFWDVNTPWLQSLLGGEDEKTLISKPYSLAADHGPRYNDQGFDDKLLFWETSLDHYALHGIDDLEKGETYRSPYFTERFGSFVKLTNNYGGIEKLKLDLEEVKKRLYVPMVID